MSSTDIRTSHRHFFSISLRRVSGRSSGQSIWICWRVNVSIMVVRDDSATVGNGTEEDKGFSRHHSTLDGLTTTRYRDITTN